MIFERNFFGKAELIPSEVSVLTKVFSQSEHLYLCGYKLANYLEFDSGFFIRLQSYLGVGLCFELSALAMFLLEGESSARLHQGYIYIHGVQYRHAWVEFISGGMPFVADLAWSLPVIMPAHVHMRGFPHREIEWTCTYKDFWDLRLSQDIYLYMQTPEKSYVWEALEAYGKVAKPGEERESFGFQKSVLNGLYGTDLFCPYRRGEGLISGDIFEELLFSPQLLRPSADTISEAEALIDFLDSVNHLS